MGKINKSEALKGVKISPLEEVIDVAMAHLPEHLDLSLPENRQKVRDWMIRIGGVILRNASEDAQRACASAIEECTALAINPDFYKVQKERRTKYKAQRALRQKMEAPKTRAQVVFDKLDVTGVKM